MPISLRRRPKKRRRFILAAFRLSSTFSPYRQSNAYIRCESKMAQQVPWALMALFCPAMPTCGSWNVKVMCQLSLQKPRGSLKRGFGLSPTTSHLISSLGKHAFGHGYALRCASYGGIMKILMRANASTGVALQLSESFKSPPITLVLALSLGIRTREFRA